MTDTDWELLSRYRRNRSDETFAELVHRHLDLVHSAALRQVRYPQLAEEIAQSTFLKLAQHAGQLAPDTILSAWLYQVTRREAIDVVRREARRQLREKIATEMNAMNATDAAWTHIEPLLDDAMAALDETDRTAVLLRYFENKSLREVGEALGASENASQKRLTRAIERLREFFVKRGISVGASGLAVIISANAVQAAPAALVVTVSTAVLSAGKTAFTAATATTATKAIAMTTLQKTLLGAAIAVAMITTVTQSHRASRLRRELRELQQQHTEQSRQIQQDRDKASKNESALREENRKLQTANAELLKLRAEANRLRDAEGELARLRAANQHAASPPTALSPSPVGEDLPKDTWADVGLNSPQAALRTRGWSVLNGNRERFKESMFITDDARKTIEDMLVRMAESSNAPDKDKLLQEILSNKFGVEEAILMPMMAENQKLGYTGYRILSQQSPTPDEAVIELETQLNTAQAKKEILRFHRFGTDWKVVIDENFVKSAR